jgi:arsenate reductase
MTGDITIYHNPRCSKSRATLELLKTEGRDPRLVEYLKEPPTAKTLDAILDMLGMEPRDLMRTKEKEYREAGLDNPGLGRAELIAAMIEHPRLIERPIVIANGKAAIGRPPEKVLEIL